MSVSLSQLLEESFQIAWEYLERTGELGDAAAASRFLSDTIETMIRRGQRSRLAISNRAITAYQRQISTSAPEHAGSGLLIRLNVRLPLRLQSEDPKCQ